MLEAHFLLKQLSAAATASPTVDLAPPAEITDQNASGIISHDTIPSQALLLTH